MSPFFRFAPLIFVAAAVPTTTLPAYSQITPQSDPQPVAQSPQPAAGAAGGQANAGPAGGQATTSAATSPPPLSSIGTTRFFIDTGVSDVRVDDTFSVATLNRSPLSPCPSNQYVYERNRPKWLLETGRLMEAMREGATVRISFTCREGLQSINAIQFIAAPAVVTQSVLRESDRSGNELAGVRRAARQNVNFPVPGNGADENLSAQERAARIPLP